MPGLLKVYHHKNAGQSKENFKLYLEVGQNITVTFIMILREYYCGEIPSSCAYTNLQVKPLKIEHWHLFCMHVKLSVLREGS